MLVEETMLPEMNHDLGLVTSPTASVSYHELGHSSQPQHFSELQETPEPPALVSFEEDFTIKWSPQYKMSRLLKDKEEEWSATMRNKRPLQLLDLPVDVLKEIIKEVRHQSQLGSRSLLKSLGHAYQRSHFSCSRSFSPA